MRVHNTQVSACEEESVTLLYFGLTFMWKDVKIAKGVKILLPQKVKELCPQLATNISKDIHHLNDCNFGKKFTTAQCFRKVPKYPVFVFEHSTHIACSVMYCLTVGTLIVTDVLNFGLEHALCH